ncbi:MAG: hypothetical protein ACP6IQ_01895 [Candidatus Njordarchaeia archaeon]
MIKSIGQIFQERDEDTHEEAQKRVEELKDDILSIAAEGGSFSEIEDRLLGEGLEMDYFDQLF